ncbi:MAG: hypothetical protein KF895_05450 [Parvibaculum sp.]|nr:hypothetical protein [Parvibaculum sp.]
MKSTARVILIASTMMSALTGAAGSTFASQPSVVGPQRTATELREAHGPISPTGFRIVYESVTDGGSKEQVTLTLAEDFIETAREAHFRLIDFKLRRSIRIDRSKRSFENYSLYGEIAFRAYEMQNRQHLRRTLESMNVNDPPSSVNPFWAAVELRVPDRTAPDAIASRRDDGDIVRFSYGGSEVSSFTLSTTQVPVALRKRFVQGMREVTSVHPAILDAMTSGGTVPQEIAYVRAKNSGGFKYTTLVLISAGPVTPSYPLPADFKADIRPDRAVAPLERPGAKILRELMPVMLDAVAGRHGSGPQSVSNYKSAIDNAMRAGQSFQALALALELSLQYGDNLSTCPSSETACHPFGKIVQAAERDPNGRALLHSFRIEQSDPAAATRERESIDTSLLSNGYLVGAFIANGLNAQGTRPEDARRLHRDAILGNPYVGSFYKDIGDHFTYSFEIPTAWLFYDLGRALPGRNQAESDPLARVDSIEKRLSADFPEFF